MLSLRAATARLGPALAWQAGLSAGGPHAAPHTALSTQSFLPALEEEESQGTLFRAQPS